MLLGDLRGPVRVGLVRDVRVPHEGDAADHQRAQQEGHKEEVDHLHRGPQLKLEQKYMSHPKCFFKWRILNCDTHFPAGEDDVDVLGLELLVDLGQVLALRGPEHAQKDPLENGSKANLV